MLIGACHIYDYTQTRFELASDLGAKESGEVREL